MPAGRQVPQDIITLARHADGGLVSVRTGYTENYQQFFEKEEEIKTRNVTIWMMVVVLCLASSQVLGVVEFKDGQTHDIDYEINDDVWVDYQAPGTETTVNWLDGASMPSDYKLQAFEDSRINVSGGSIGNYLSVYDSSQVTMSGGSIDGWLSVWQRSQATISGGSIDDLKAEDGAQIAISGGSIRGSLYTFDSSQVDICGGSMGGELGLEFASIITILGSDFAVDGEDFGYGELTSIFGGNWCDEPFRHLTGILASGELLDNDFRIGHDARIVLVPEPASAVMLGLGSLFLALRRRRQ